MSQVIRRHEINRRRKRQATVRKLRARLAKATNKTDQQKFLTKLRKVAPWIPDREWLNPAHLQNAEAAAPQKETKRPAKRAA